MNPDGARRLSMFFPILFLVLIVSQLYWFRTLRSWLRHLVVEKRARRIAGGTLLATYLFMIAFNFGVFGRFRTPVHLTPAQALLVAPFLWWVASSLVGFLLAVLISPIRLAAHGVRRLRPEQPENPRRRELLARTATAITTAPFVAGAYGLLYGRLNLQTPTQRI